VALDKNGIAKRIAKEMNEGYGSEVAESKEVRIFKGEKFEKRIEQRTVRVRG